MLSPAAVDSASAAWGASMLRASVEGGLVIALVWALCRAWPQMSPSGRSWLWRVAFCKLLLSLCWRGSVGVPLLPLRAAQEVARKGVSSASGASPRSSEVDPSRELFSLRLIRARRRNQRREETRASQKKLLFRALNGTSPSGPRLHKPSRPPHETPPLCELFPRRELRLQAVFGRKSRSFSGWLVWWVWRCEV